MSKRKGFTFIEIALFLAVTAALFIGVALGINKSIFQQQYNDATQNFFEFLRSVYSQVSNPQSVGEGNSENAIYGKLIVFGETVDLLGNSILNDEQQIFVYDVIGSVESDISGGILKALGAAKINVIVVKKGSNDRIQSVDLASPEKYVPRWSVRIEDIDGNPIEKSILIVRHPSSGTINTLVSNRVIEVNKKVQQVRSCIGNTSCPNAQVFEFDNTTKALKNFSVLEDTDFCINPYGEGEREDLFRRDIKIFENARNASSVQLMELDADENTCK